MQSDQSPDQWKQPTERQSAAPYAPPDLTESDAPGPVVTLSPDSEQPIANESELQSDSDEPEAAPESGQPSNPMQDDQPIVRWQANEYIHREKNGVWYVFFAAIVLILMASALFLMHSWTFAVLLPVMAAALIVYAKRPPRLLSYTLSRQGLHVNDRLYGFSEFKSFAVIKGDDEYSVMLVPVKRFRPGVSVYFPEDAGEAIVDTLAARLPMREAQLDAIDRLIRKLRI